MEVMSPPHGACAGSGGGGGAGRRSSDSSSPEFEFWMVRNPSSPQPHLLSADELFVDGVILPLHLLHQPTSDPPPPEPEQLPEPEDQAAPPASTAAAPAAPTASASKRWRDIFRGAAGGERVRAAEERERRKERKGSAGGAAELNINIWPFSRSRSAGTGGARPKGGAAAAAPGRRVSSAPVSRSNSLGESSSSCSKPPATPGGGMAGLPTAGGFHVGRISPVWRVRRGSKKGAVQSDDVAATGDGGGSRKGNGGSGVRVLNLNVNTCIGYGQEPSCGGDNKEDSTVGDQTSANINNGNGNSNGSHFNLKTFFSKKV